MVMLLSRRVVSTRYWLRPRLMNWPWPLRADVLVVLDHTVPRTSTVSTLPSITQPSHAE